MELIEFARRFLTQKMSEVIQDLVMHLTYASGGLSMPPHEEIYENEAFINNSMLGDLGMNTEKANMVSKVNNHYSTDA
jgi:hypothetical protein